MNDMELFLHNLTWNIRMFGKDPISTLIIGFFVTCIVVVAYCLIKIAIITSHEEHEEIFTNNSGEWPG